MTRFLATESEMNLSEAKLRPGSPRRAIWEFSIAYAMILLALWTPLPWQRFVSLLALAWVIWSTSRSFDGWGAMGFRIKGVWRSAWVVCLALALAACGVFIASRLQTLHVPNSPLAFLSRYWSYTIWSFLQEFLLLNFFLLRFLRLIANRHVAALTATTLFALAHLPSPILTALTLIWGFAACEVFLHYRNIYVPAMAHAILGICVAITIPGPVDHNMRVGLGYLTYREHHHHVSGFSAARSTTPYPR